MKTTLTIISLFVASLNLLAQCSVSTSSTPCCNPYSFCSGTATANPTGQSPFTYSWTTVPVQTGQTAVGLCPGNYTVTLTDANACTATDTITVYPVILNTISSSPASCSTCCDGSATVFPSGGSSPYSYIWNPTGGTTQTETGLCAWIQNIVCVTDINGCVSCDTVTVGFTTSVESMGTEDIFNIFPNPSNGSFTVNFDNADIKEIILTDLLGNIVFRQQTDKQTEIKIDNLASGTYFLTAIDKYGRQTKRKIISCP